MRHDIKINLSFRYRRQYKAAKPEDLWTAVEEAAKEDKTQPKDVTVSEFAKSWTDNPGYPVLTAIRDYSSHNIQITQVSFNMPF